MSAYALHFAISYIQIFIHIKLYHCSKDSGTIPQSKKDPDKLKVYHLDYLDLVLFEIRIRKHLIINSNNEYP